MRPMRYYIQASPEAVACVRSYQDRSRCRAGTSGSAWNTMRELVEIAANKRAERYKRQKKRESEFFALWAPPLNDAADVKVSPAVEQAQRARRRGRLDDARQKLTGNTFQNVFDAVITLQKLKPSNAEVSELKLASPVKRVWDNTGHAAPVRSGAYQLLERFIIDAQDARGVEDSERGTVDAVLAACNIKTPRKKRRTD